MTRASLIRWLLAALASLGVVVFVVSGGPGASVPSVAPTVVASGCVPTDQDQYVYHPARLQVLQACIRVTGTVAAVRNEPDGDFHILVALDPAFASLLRPANANELGDLVIEPVCEHTVSQSDAIATCAGDHDPLNVAALSVGQHVYLEGRYVLDLDHGSWSELHPLYRWGAA